MVRLFVCLFVCVFILSGCGTKIAKKIGLASGERDLQIFDDKSLIDPPFLEEDIKKLDNNNTNA